ncbi:helix-turn-helix domain-containing protein [Lentzea flaviverrucosa]|jgi:transcriptional regulator with XRE-family HTH domain|uniref:Helix-turn-helix domain-containing protein n=1 Tax=Lentzea flaviverrucosa TaxID=200379 RepID=A0A1H9G492_9PSEU|nr:helix-turn-helix transcriptional regulator [Lentzea flaviverrucosa]RDI35016.1 helix-turn-helix protein [Lentzea flaviverrucosa]SEQ44922.1 Helix-turn-helix domain-containing protein [Lentzea flaviverrucosa]
MATSTPSTAYSRDLGDELRKVRETSSALTGAALAVRLGWDPSKVSTLENGKYRPSEIDLVQYLSMLGKDIDFFEDFKRRFRYAFEEYIVQVSDNLRTLAMAESTAIMITSYDPQAVPGLSQTPEYADSLYRMGGYIVEERIPTVVKFRMDRQVILNRHDRPTCLFYIHEHALQTQVGDAQIMEDQYAKLLFGAPTIRIVPATAKLVATSCVLWEYDKAMPVAFTSTDLAKVFVQDPGAIARTRLLFDRLAEVALDEEQSRKVLADYVGRPREELNERGPRLA